MHFVFKAVHAPHIIISDLSAEISRQIDSCPSKQSLLNGFKLKMRSVVEFT